MASSSSDGDVFVVERVEPLATAALGHDETVLAQHAQLVGYRRLFHSDRRHQLANGVGPLAQLAEDPDPTRGRKREHRVRDRFRGLRRQRAGGVVVAAHPPPSWTALTISSTTETTR